MARFGARMPAMAMHYIYITSPSRFNASLHVRNVCQEEFVVLATLPNHR